MRIAPAKDRLISIPQSSLLTDSMAVLFNQGRITPEYSVEMCINLLNRQYLSFQKLSINSMRRKCLNILSIV